MTFLESLTYKEKYFHKQSETILRWELEGLKLRQFTLIAGLNTAGKTRTCNVIKNTLKKIVQPMKGLEVGETDIVFKTSKNKTYRLIISIKENKNLDRNITAEELYQVYQQEEKPLFDRTKLYDNRSRRDVEYTPPDDSLTFHARRDKKSYPYLEEIIEASKRFHFLDFRRPRAEITKHPLPEGRLPNEFDSSLTPLLFEELVDDKKKGVILSDLESLGYFIKNISVKSIQVEEFKVPLIFFDEEGVGGIYDYTQASEGMVKVIFLIVALNLIEKGSCLLIDNIGDGLDYKRSMDIVPILEKASEDKQIILCTNNEILLNQTDIRNWNILYREGYKVKAFNYENNRDQLLKFSETGLSNYEYFKSEYFLK